jgi:hypothetical protein
VPAKEKGCYRPLAFDLERAARDEAERIAQRLIGLNRSRGV